ncbi:MAG: caspase family protein, partial [Thermoguttaceae bacterium]|nr:caspase family protein [Thermoguttaceae bacterium]
MKAEIALWLAGCRPDEAMILYFSGHGFRDDQNRLYLAAVDCDPADPKPGGIPVAELREMIVDCAARSKLLVLDACHAGSAGSACPEKAAQAKEMNEFFEQTEGLITLASCTGAETSQLWPAKKQSLFAYWLAQGLRGHADREPLGQITINELDDYVSQKVRWSAKKLWSLEQTPTRLQGPGVSADMAIRLQPCDLKTLLDDLAEQMDVLIRLAEIEEVGVVPEFVSSQSGNRLGREYGLLATNCPVELANRLSVKSDGDYRVLSINAIRETLQEKGIAPRDVGTSRSRGLSVEGNSVGALVDGRVIGLQGEALTLQCNLLGTEDESLLGFAGGTARLCGSELAMQGASGVTEPAVEPQSVDRAALTPAQIDAAAPHPLGDRAFPDGVRVML